MFAQPKTPPTKYPRIYNHFLASLTTDDYDRLADYDIVTLIPEAQYYYPDFFIYARRKNPDIIILPYLYSQSVNTHGLDDAAGLKRAFYELATEERYLHTSTGNRILLWEDILWAANLATDWPDRLPQLIQEKVLSTGVWDGIFFDMVESSVGHYANGDIDIDNDGQRDPADKVNRLWRDGMIRLLKTTRDVIGPEKYILINGDSYEGYQPYVNGRLFESFPTPWEGKGKWEDSMRPYVNLQQLNREPFLSVLNTTVEGRGGRENYKLIRYSIASALLGDGYLSVDESIASHAQIWWYDEYNASLGAPTSGPEDVLRKTDTKAFAPSVWRRDFQNGIVLVNSTNEKREIRFREEFEKIHGVQDPVVNDGAIVDRVMLGRDDGILLLRPVEEIIGSVFQNGSFVRVFTKEGRVGRTGFFSYDARFRGGNTVVRHDVDGDGALETVVATRNSVQLWKSDGTRHIELFPYGETFQGGIALAVGDMDGDGRVDLVTAPESNAPIEVKVWSLDGALIRSFFPFGNKTIGGASVAVGHVRADLRPEIIVGRGRGGEPIVRIFSEEGELLHSGWLAYPKRFRGGVNVAVGDLDGNGVAEIITGTGFGGGPHVRLFAGNGRLLHPGWFAYDKRTRGGVRVTAADLDNDGKAEILTMTTDVFTITASGN